MTIVFVTETYALTTRVLMSLVVPGHLVFIYTISWVQRGEVVLTPAFVTSYLIVSLIQVCVVFGLFKLYLSFALATWSLCVFPKIRLECWVLRFSFS